MSNLIQANKTADEKDVPTPRMNATGSTPVNLIGLSKVYGELTAADSVYLDIQSGEFMTFLGPSGSGKTTTLKMVAGFIEPTSGQVEIGGDVVTAPPHKRDIGMVFQNYALFPHMSAVENVAFPLKMRGGKKASRLKKAGEMLDLVGLGDRTTWKPHQLSGGQQQRVALARALVFEPRLVLMDEPLGALDKKLREYLQLEIRRIQQELGITMIYVTHDQEEALVMSDRISVFNEGKIVQVGTGEDLYERPGSKFVADFIGESNMFLGSVKSDGKTGVFVSEVGRFATPSPPTVSRGTAWLVVRPERLTIGTPEAHEGEQVNSVEGVVKRVTYLGGQREVEVVLGEGHSVVSRTHAGSVAPPAVGEKVSASWLAANSILTTE